MQTKRNFWMQTLKDNAGLILLFIFLIAFPFILGALTDSSPYGVPRGDRMIMRGESVRWQAVLIEVYIFSILAMSYNLMFGFTGVISFGHALFFGLGGYILGLVLEYTQIDNTLALFVALAIALVVSALVGLFIGVVSLRLRGVYFAIFTLAVAEMGFIFFSRFSYTRAEDGFAISELPVWIDPTQSRLNFYYLALILFVLTFLFIRRLVNSPTGAVLKAVRENEDRAQALGYHTLRFKLLSIILAGMLAAVAGMLQVLLNKKVGPEILSLSYTVDPLLMTIIGGIGTLSGPVIGAAGLHLLDTFLRDAVFTVGDLTIDFASFWGLVLGLIFIVVVMVFPQGVVGTLSRWRNNQRKAPLPSTLPPP